MRLTEPIMDETRARVLKAQRTHVFRYRTGIRFPGAGGEVADAAVVTVTSPWSRP
jgi:hypothetical protein